MSRSLVVELSDEAYRGLTRQAEAAGTSPALVAATSLEQQFRSPKLGADEAARQAARARFERHFGEVDLGRPTGPDNDSIDADLATEYADTHEDG